MLKPLNGKVVVSIEKKNETESGLILTSNLESDTIVARVIAISKYYDKYGKIENNFLNIGNAVIISKFSGTRIEYDNNEYLILDIENILAVVEEE